MIHDFHESGISSNTSHTLNLIYSIIDTSFEELIRQYLFWKSIHAYRRDAKLTRISNGS